jgi:hypothetical protein
MQLVSLAITLASSQAGMFQRFIIDLLANSQRYLLKRHIHRAKLKSHRYRLDPLPHAGWH